jgi:hypothetical protein
VDLLYPISKQISFSFLFRVIFDMKKGRGVERKTKAGN